MASHAAARRRRRITRRLGAVTTSFALTLTVLASTVTAAPMLPGWVLLPLEASGMPAHLASPMVVTTAPERADISISLADYAAQQEVVEAAAGSKTRSEAVTRASRADRSAEIQKAEPVVPINQAATPAAVPVPDGDEEVLVPDDGEESVPEPELVPGPDSTEERDEIPEPAPAPDPAASTDPESADTELGTTPERGADPAPEPVTPEPEVTTPEPAAPEAPAPGTEPEPTTPAPVPEPTTPAPQPEPTTPAPEPEPTTPPPPPAPEPPTAPTGDTGTARNTLFAFLNTFRQANGEAKVEYDAHLQSVAQGWADHLASWQPTSMLTSHNPRMTQQVGCRGYSTGTWGGCSELIVRNTGGAHMTFETVLQVLHTWWVNSDGHRPWMLEPSYTHVGYGFAWSPTGVPYAVTVIAQKH